jgi:hypothetical protein
MRRPLVLALLGAALGLAACGGGGAEEYPAEAQRSFVDACVAQNGANRSACECALDQVQENVSYKEFRKAEAALTSGLEVNADTQDAFLEAVADCTD